MNEADLALAARISSLEEENHQLREDARALAEALRPLITWKEDSKWAIRHEEDHILVQRLQEGVNIGHEAEALLSRPSIQALLDNQDT